MASIRDIFVRLGVKTDPRGFRRAEAGINNLKTSAVSLARIFATGALAIGFKKIIDAASDMEESANKFGAVFGEAGEGVQKQLEDISKRTGATSTELIEMAANIGALIKPSLGSAKAAGTFATQISEAALDIASFNNITTDEALLKLRAGLIGSQEPLQSVGVNLKEGALQLAAARLGFRGLVKDMTPATKLSLRLASIQEQLGEQGATGDATRTADGFANASRNLRSALAELAGNIGSFFLPRVEKLVLMMRNVTRGFKAWLKVNKDVIKQRIERLFDRIGKVISAVTRFIGRTVDAAKDWIASLDSVSLGFLKLTAIAAALAAILLLPGGALLLLLALVGLIIEDFEKWRKGGDGVITDLVGSMKFLAEEFPILSTIIAEVAAAFGRWFQFMFNIVGSFVGFWVDIFSGDFKTAFTDGLANVRQAFMELFGVDSFLAKIVGATFDAFGTAVGLFADAWIIQFNIIKAVFKAVFDFINREVEETIKKVERIISGEFIELGIGKFKGLLQSLGFGGGETAPGAPTAQTAIGPAAATATATGGARTSSASFVDQSTINVKVQADPGMDMDRLINAIPEKIREAREAENRQTLQSFVVEAP